MITRSTAFVTSDNETFATLEGAQGHELMLVLGCADDNPVIPILLKNADRIIDILTTTPTSKPRARKANGGTKKRKAAVTPELPNV